MVLFEDTHLIVINKPAGLLSQGESKGDPNLVDALREYFGRNYVGLVHRLDRNTSGVIVVAKRTKSAQRLTEALQKDKMERVYLALLCGKLAAPARWQHYLKKNERDNRVTAFKREAPGAQMSALSVKPLEYKKLKGLDLTLAEFRLETGRSHQIRAQSAAEGFPLLGDRKYGAPVSDFSRPALHSWKIKFPHPMSAEILELTAPIPGDMLAI